MRRRLVDDQVERVETDLGAVGGGEGDVEEGAGAAPVVMAVFE